jgi:hypothetical protein
MAAAPRHWMKLDLAFLTRGSIEDLGLRCGPAGPLAIIALATETHAANLGGRREDVDTLTWRYSYLARRCFVDADAVRAIVQAAQSIGLVELFDEDGDEFTVRMKRFREWHGKDPNATVRKRASRARAAAG